MPTSELADSPAWVLSSTEVLHDDGRITRALFRRVAWTPDSWPGLVPRWARRRLDAAALNLGLLSDAAAALRCNLDGGTGDGSHGYADYEAIAVDLLEEAWAARDAIAETLADQLDDDADDREEPTPPAPTTAEPTPLVTLLVDDLVSAPTAPPHRHPLVAAAA